MGQLTRNLSRPSSSSLTSPARPSCPPSLLPPSFPPSASTPMCVCPDLDLFGGKRKSDKALPQTALSKCCFPIFFIWRRSKNESIQLFIPARENPSETDQSRNNNEKKEKRKKRNKTRKRKKQKQKEKQRNLNKTVHWPSWSKMGFNLIPLVVAQRLRFGDHGHRNKQVHLRASFTFLLLNWQGERCLLRSAALKFHHGVGMCVVRRNTKGKNMRQEKNKKRGH